LTVLAAPLPIRRHGASGFRMAYLRRVVKGIAFAWLEDGVTSKARRTTLVRFVVSVNLRPHFQESDRPPQGKSLPEKLGGNRLPTNRDRIRDERKIAQVRQLQGPNESIAP